MFLFIDEYDNTITLFETHLYYDIHTLLSVQ